MSDEPAVYDHYREAGDASDDAGELFRVVGVGEQLTLLRLTENDERTATGDLRYVDRNEFADRFTLASNPDPRFGIPDYLGALFVIGGIALAVSAPDDIFAGALVAAAGVFVLWRRHG
ncbi:hypothetical protein [Halolamina sp.]|jgi:hypothetical protein|uniref:hypothetical protein n=1 Tax=Halolamina sp. TaxID=1940283 RepID=UPI000223BF24|nr:hypothetical protein Halar_3360 [halophilic archaeon DL31]